MKTTPLKKLQFIALLALATAIGLQATHAYQLNCPEVSQIRKDQQGNIFLYTGTATSQEGPSVALTSQPRMDQDYDLRLFHKSDLRLNFRRMICYYKHGENELLTLSGDLPAGSRCSVESVPGTNFLECR